MSYAIGFAKPTPRHQVLSQSSVNYCCRVKSTTIMKSASTILPMPLAACELTIMLFSTLDLTPPRPLPSFGYPSSPYPS